MIDEIFLEHHSRAQRATLFLHGFTASPLQFAALAEHAYALGDNVYVPRLPRHGHEERLTETLRELRACELLTHAQQSLAVAAQHAERVRVVGFSLGGLLAAWLAQRYEIERAIAIAPLLGLAGVPVRWTTNTARMLLRMPNRFVWWNPLLRANLMPAHGYPRFPTHALAQLLLIADDVFRYAREKRGRSPITFVTNSGETAVNNRAVARLAGLWQAAGSRTVEQHRLTGLGLSHDIIEPLRADAKVEKSYPLVRALLEK
jgi:carboxylesterase